MICVKCENRIEPGEQRDHFGETLCEDCYMDRLSPAKGCDPWAVRSAKSTMELAGGDRLSERQERILLVLGQTGGVSLTDLAYRLGMPMSDLEKEAAALRHMEKLRSAMQGGHKVLVLW